MDSGWMVGLKEGLSVMGFLIVLAGIVAWWTRPRKNVKTGSWLPPSFWRGLGV